MNTLRKALSFVVDLLQPQDPLVREIESLAPSAFVERARRLDQRREMPGAFILFEYKDPLVRKSLFEAKFRGNTKIASLLGAIVADHLVEELVEERAFANFSDPLFCVVPMTKKGLRARGWNQCELIASTAAKNMQSATFLPSLMEKIKETGDQVGMSRAERLANLRGSFRVADPGSVRGRNVIVLDDIVTTGATMKEAKRALRSAGARRVLLVALAH